MLAHSEVQVQRIASLKTLNV